MIRRVLAILLASVFSVTASSGSEPVYVQEKLQYAEITNYYCPLNFFSSG